MLKSLPQQDQEERVGGSGRLDKVVILWFDVSVRVVKNVLIVEVHKWSN